MKLEPVVFTNADGKRIVGRIEYPADRHPFAYALFAHCFTCSKNLNAVRNISRALSMNGIATLGFDFTGLGESEGDFAETGFSSNIEDIRSAAEFMAQRNEAPTLLIGHSLGGTAVLAAAARIPGVKAIATIGAPFHPAHVRNLFGQSLEAIDAGGSAQVNIGGRPFLIRREFIEDLEQQEMEPLIRSLNLPLLVMHAPFDRIVGIDNAARIYEAALHPKSFISLDDAGHLLADASDSAYAGSMIASWASRYLDEPAPLPLKSPRSVAVRVAEGLTAQVRAGAHGLIADEPTEVGGNDFGPSPYELLSASLGTCTAMTLRLYADRKGWPLESVTVHLDHDKVHALDGQQTEASSGKIDRLVREIELEGPLDEDQRSRLLSIANKCPVHRTLLSDILIDTSLQDERPAT